MKKLSISIIVALVTFSVGVIAAAIWMTRKTPELTSAVAPNLQCVPLATQKLELVTVGEEGYFPKAALYRNEHTDQLARSLYAKYLGRMKEPSLLNSHANDKYRVYRFTWLRSFHSKVVVRVWTDDHTRTLTIKELGPENQNQSGQMRVDQTRQLTEDEWSAFTRLFNEACLWTLPSTRGDAIAEDGAWWVFEANVAGYYHIVARQSPDASYRDLCLYMLKLSGLQLDPAKGEIY